MTPRQPSYDEVAALPVSLGGVVGPEHLDANDHVNIQHYLAWADLASGLWCEGLGLGMDEYARRGLSQFVAEYHLAYLGELRRGSHYSAHVRILDRGARALHTMTYVLDNGQRRLSCAAEMMAINVDLKTRRTTDYPPDIARALDDRLARDAQTGWPVVRSGAMAVRRGRS
ncbi:thioesterase [Streptomyces phaeolivaceus]|uniref:Thioesterase n=1 Tax=Streptomyces phaeolivaceus TaxID=2653200 RepID=A0A5P8KF59_9ACTN|nr:thioesterase family protein [Streptomyces phaeolivaceus]QFR01651.1 thioesterase [Streptomyces phaeolivaceus]